MRSRVDSWGVRVAGSRKAVRVMIVDDDELLALGEAALLAAVDGIEVVGVCAFESALGLPPETWADVDLLVVDAHDRDAAWDYFAGVDVVRALRRCPTSSRTTVVVISGHCLNDQLRLRMASAGADYFYPRSEVRSPAALIEIILDPARGPLAEMRSTAKVGARIGPASRPNEVLDYVQASGLTAAFDPALTQEATGLSRRAILRERKRVAKLADLRTCPYRLAAGPNRRATLPTWKEVVGYVHRARGADVAA